MIPHALAPLPIRHDPPLGPNEQMPVDGYYVEMPVGGQVVSVGSSGGQLAALAVFNPKGLKVRHPLYLLPVGRVWEAPIGAKVGECLGLIDGQVGVFKALPWPTAAVIAP